MVGEGLEVKGKDRGLTDVSFCTKKKTGGVFFFGLVDGLGFFDGDVLERFVLTGLKSSRRGGLI